MIELVTFADLKTFMDLEGSTISEYPDLLLIRDNVTSKLENFCNREFEVKTRTLDTIIEANQSEIQIDAYPVTVVNSVTLDGVTLTTDDYRLLKNRLILNENLNGKSLIFEYQGGLSTIPPDLKTYAMVQTVYEYKNKSTLGVQSFSNIGGSITKSTLGLLKEVKEALTRNFKRPNAQY